MEKRENFLEKVSKTSLIETLIGYIVRSCVYIYEVLFLSHQRAAKIKKFSYESGPSGW